MGLKRYLRLIKSADTAAKLKAHYIINLVMSTVQFTFILLYFFLEKNSTISFICGLIFVGVALIYIVSARVFLKNLKSAVAAEHLDLDVPIDLAISLYRTAFLDFIDSKKTFSKIVNKIEFVLALLIFTAFGAMCVIGLSGNIAILEILQPIIVSATVIIFVLTIVFTAFAASFNGSWWENELSEEISIIDKFKVTQLGRTYRKKYKILEDISQVEQNKFLFPTEGLRKEADDAIHLSKKYFGLSIIIAIIVAIVSGILSALFEWNLAFLFGGLIVAMICFNIFVAFKSSSRLKKQYKILQLNENLYQKQIKLHEIKKALYKKWNIIFALGLAAIILLPMISGAIIQLLSANEDIMIIIVLVCWVGGFVALFWSWSIAFGRTRLVMREIEKEIELDMNKVTGTNIE